MGGPRRARQPSAASFYSPPPYALFARLEAGGRTDSNQRRTSAAAYPVRARSIASRMSQDVEEIAEEGEELQSIVDGVAREQSSWRRGSLSGLPKRSKAPVPAPTSSVTPEVRVCDVCASTAPVAPVAETRIPSGAQAHVSSIYKDGGQTTD